MNSAGGYTSPEVVKTAILLEIKGAGRVTDLQETREEFCGMASMLTLSAPTRRYLHSRPHQNGQAPTRGFQAPATQLGRVAIQSR